MKNYREINCDFPKTGKRIIVKVYPEGSLNGNSICQMKDYGTVLYADVEENNLKFFFENVLGLRLVGE